MKKILKSISLILVILMLFTAFAACDKDNDTSKETEDSKNDTSSVSSSTEGGKNEPNDPPLTENSEFKVPSANYGKDFNILASKYIYTDFVQCEDTSNSLDLAIYERDGKIKTHLGVTLKYNLVGSSSMRDIASAFNALKANHASGDDAYQLYLTDASAAVLVLATQYYVSDLQTFEDINLNADYWNKEVMEELEYKSKLYYGVSDYMIANPNVVFFNKTMQENYKIRNPYEMVRDGTWTLENMTVESMKVAEPGDKATKNLGLGTIGEWHFVSFLDSCDVEIVKDEGGYKTLDMSAANERYANVYDQLEALCASDTSLLYDPATHDVHDPDKSIASGRVLFSFVALHQANDYRKTDVKFGILPYPKYDTDQKEYRSFDWSGLMCVPVTIKDPNMVGQVLECLSYFSANGENNIHTAYYENLLGSKLADAPDDYEMLKIIYDGVVTNCAINMIEGAGSTSSGLKALAFSFHYLASYYRVNASSTKPDGIAVQWATHGTLAQKALDNTINS